MVGASVSRTILVAALAAFALLIGLVFSSDSRAGVVKSYCSPTGDYCIAVANRGGRAKLEISSSAFNEYDVCVKGQGFGDCVTNIDMKPGDEGIYSSRIDLLRKFHLTQAGSYKAAWFVGDQLIGKPLKFQLG